MALHANFQRDIRGRPSHAQDHIAVLDLPVVKCHLSALIYLTLGQFRSACDAATILATIGKIDALIPQLSQQWTAAIYLEGRAVAVGDGDGMSCHSQISLVQSPPG